MAPLARTGQGAYCYRPGRPLSSAWTLTRGRRIAPTIRPRVGCHALGTETRELTQVIKPSATYARVWKAPSGVGRVRDESRSITPQTLLVVSDLHLGEGKDPQSGRYRRRENFFADAAFRRFLAYHDPMPTGSAMLVLNGDTFDFGKITACLFALTTLSVGSNPSQKTKIAVTRRVTTGRFGPHSGHSTARIRAVLRGC